ncbi:MAG: ribonuclease HII [Myxococcota bacterium]
MNLSQLSLAELERHFRAVTEEATLERLTLALRCDSRVGARSLAARWARRLARGRAERLRVAQLFALRGSLLRRGVRVVAGVDEVGVGPLAGPVVAAAVVLPERVELPGLRDSKRLSRTARDRLEAAIQQQAQAIAIGSVEPVEIDRLNIYRAALEAMRRAVKALATPPDHLLVDARTVPGVAAPQTAIVRGDDLDGSIAAASIVAKVHRDSIMDRLDAIYPGYGFGRHMGYGTPQHLAALQRLGPSPVHRRSFAPVAAFLPA